MAVIVAAARPVRAADEWGEHPSRRHTVEVSKAEPRGHVWYGWQVAVADATAAGVIVTGLVTHVPPVVVLGAGAFVIGGPIVHAVQDSTRVVPSILMRCFLPLAGAALASGYCTGEGRDCSSVSGIVTGAIAASVIDVILADRETR